MSLVRKGGWQAGSQQVPPLPQPDDVIGVSVVSDQRPPEWAVIAVSMSEVLPFSEAEQRGHYADGGGDGQIPLTCRLQDTGNFYGSSGQGGGKRPPKLGQIGRSKRVVIEEDERIEDVLMSEKAPPAV
ncbi:calcium/calmodulin-dependent protein kinase II inhibitor 1 isoform X2 [Aquarana catesbeiana]|uniref:calcium/calmodulin-dependent protein kinase II inhibitor 1 isoform X2 n=1 Tax=Aquarana catesbeiana TaxID=8400 RepID=UPI003CCA1623